MSRAAKSHNSYKFNQIFRILFSTFDTIFKSTPDAAEQQERETPRNEEKEKGQETEKEGPPQPVGNFGSRRGDIHYGLPRLHAQILLRL